jgi:hypothetical protein
MRIVAAEALWLVADWLDDARSRLLELAGRLVT